MGQLSFGVFYFTFSHVPNRFLSFYVRFLSILILEIWVRYFAGHVVHDRFRVCVSGWLEGRKLHGMSINGQIGIFANTIATRIYANGGANGMRTQNLIN